MKYFDEYASQEENKRTWKKYMIEFHPDKNGGDHTKVNALNTQWDKMQQGYKSGVFPKIKQQAQAQQPFNIFGGKARPAAAPPDETIYTQPWKRKKYTGTVDEIYIQIIADHGFKDGTDFYLKFYKEKTGNSFQADILNIFIKNLFK